MSQSAEKQSSGSGRIGLVLITIVLIAAVVSVAWYQEQIGYFLRLRTWDKAAPARTVLTFLEAGKSGDQAKADRQLGTKDLQPLVKNTKWEGYVVKTLAGDLEFRMKDLVPAQFPTNPKSEFELIGDGTAEVFVPDRTG